MSRRKFKNNCLLQTSLGVSTLSTNEKHLVFIVDDNADVADLLAHFLANHEYHTQTFHSGEDVLEVLYNPTEATTPDVILIDLMMPGLDGIEVIRRIRAMPKLSHIPIIMVTANGQNQNRINGLESGADDFLAKPISRAELLARVRSLLRLKIAFDEKDRLLLEVQQAYDQLAAARHELVEIEKSKLQMDTMLSTAAGICHEMSQPLTTALITIQLVQQVSETSNQEDLLVVEKSLLQARVVLDKLRALTRYETTSYNDQEHILDIHRSSDTLLYDFNTTYGSDDTTKPG